MLSAIKFLGKWVAVLAGVSVIVLAIALGGFRLLASQLPGYQAEIQAWLNAELGLHVEFDRLDLRMAFGGPEVSFYDSAIASEDPEQPFVVARETTIRFDPLALILNRQFVARRLAIAGIRLTVVRNEDGSLVIAGAPSGADMVLDFDFQIPPEVELVIRDSSVTYEDRDARVRWPFENVSVEVNQGPDSVEMTVRAEPPPALGSRIEMSVDGSLEDLEALTDDWRGYLGIRDADLATLARLWPSPEWEGLGGRGDISIWLQSLAGVVDQATVELSLSELALPARGARGSVPFDRMSLTAEWNREAAGWQLAISGVELARAGREWRRGGNSVLRWSDAGVDVDLRSDYLRLDDLTPFVRLLPASDARTDWLAFDPRGEVEELELVFAAGQPDDDFEIAGRFTDIAVQARYGRPGIEGLSGELRADSRGGRLQLESATSTLSWPALVDPSLELEDLSGVVVWREGRDALLVVTDDLTLRVFGAEISTSLEATLPHDDALPHLDLVSRLSGEFDVRAVKPYFPESLMPAGAYEWLERGISAGTVAGADLTFFGPPAAFPFDGGEGQFDLSVAVRDGRVDYLEGWPAAESLNGEVRFVNAGFRGAGSGRVLGNVSENVDVTIADMRDPVLRIQADTEGPLADFLQYLNDAPLIARYLGPSYARLSAPMGTAEVNLDLSVPLLDIPAYELGASLDIIDGELAVDGFAPHASDIRGRLELSDGVVTGENIEATFLDGPVIASVAGAELPGYRARLDVEGEVTADAVLRAFSFSHREFFAGQTLWQGSLYLPSQGLEPLQPVLIVIDSNLSGVGLKFPQPFAKAPGEPTNLELQFAFVENGDLNVDGNLGATRRFMMRYENVGERFQFARGGVRFGGGLPRLPEQSGLVLEGDLASVDLQQWFAVSKQANLSASYPLIASIDLDLMELSAFGQVLGPSHLSVARSDEHWLIGIDSGPVAGSVELPRVLAGRPMVNALFERLHLQTGRETGLSGIDPRDLPGLSIGVEDFIVGLRRFGRLDAEVLADPMGLRLVSFEAATESFVADGSGAWLDSVGGVETRLALSMSSGDVAGTLTDLDLDPVIEGESAEVTASLHWPGGPGRGWMEHLSGDIGIRVNKGSMLDIDPGAGRLVGLMSVMALPRRLALDFRDVFNKGFAFDEISGDFMIIDGNAYTDNLKLSGPGAEIGVVGRTGLRDRDFRQQAVVTAEPSNILPTVGGLIGGAGVGAALLIFTRIFKEPLRGIGQVSYCITGSWDEPTVERLTHEQLAEEALCAELPPGLTQLVSEGAR